jgi:hypothetical protein
MDTPQIDLPSVRQSETFEKQIKLKQSAANTPGKFIFPRVVVGSLTEEDKWRKEGIRKNSLDSRRGRTMERKDLCKVQTLIKHFCNRRRRIYMLDRSCNQRAASTRQLEKLFTALCRLQQRPK